MSEFGAGYATCLRQFVNHRARLARSVAFQAQMRQRNPDLFAESGVETWANGASDHLYDLHRPRRGVPRSEWDRALKLQDRALDIGHGFQPSSKSDPAEARALLDEADALLGLLTLRGHRTATLAEAMATDKALGLAPKAGDYSCAEVRLRDLREVVAGPSVDRPRSVAGCADRGRPARHRALGLAPKAGDYSCAEDIAR
jgi:hypothetical protein